MSKRSTNSATAILRGRRAASACTGARCGVFSRSTRRITDRRTQPGFLGARGVLRGGSRPAVTREGGAEPLRSLLAGNLLGQQVVEEIALEQRDAVGAADLDGVVRFAAQQDDAARVGGGDGVAQLVAVSALDVVAQLRGPVQLGEVEAAILTLDERQREGGQAVEAAASGRT